MPPSELYLVGEVHIDPEKYDRITKILHHLEPDVVGVEDLWEPFQRRLGTAYYLLVGGEKAESELIDQKLSGNPQWNPDTVRLFMNSSYFGAKAIHDYTVPRGIPIVFCEEPSVQEYVHSEEQGIRTELEDFWGQVFSVTPEKYRSVVSSAYRNDTVDEETLNVAQTEKRDAYTENVLRQQEGKMVYVGGQLHIFDYPGSLFNRLEDLNPTRMKLSEADSLPAPRGDDAL